MALTTPMYTAKSNSPQTTLAADIAADTATIVLADASVLPSAPNLATIGTDQNAEVIYYGSLSGNTISDILRGQSGTTASAWGSGAPVARYFTSYDYEAFRSNIQELDTDLDGKQDTYTQSASAWDTTPTASSTNPVTSGGIKTYVDSHADFKVTGTVSASNYTLTDARINDEHWEVAKIYFATPSNVISGISWTTNITNHTVSISATYAGATNVVVKMHWVQ